jgi:hypothetical protein
MLPPFVSSRRDFLRRTAPGLALLPYDQILELLGWTAERLAYTLREDDFFFHKVGHLKPKSLPLRWAPPTAEQEKRAREIAGIVRECFPDGSLEGKEPLFSFIDPLLDPALDPYPDGLLARFAALGENAVCCMWSCPIWLSCRGPRIRRSGNAARPWEPS